MKEIKENLEHKIKTEEALQKIEINIKKIKWIMTIQFLGHHNNRIMGTIKIKLTN